MAHYLADVPRPLLFAVAVCVIGLARATAQTPCTAPLETYSVRAGKHDFDGGYGLDLSRIGDGEEQSFTMRFSLDSAAWFDPRGAGPLGRDGKDWNKLGGLSYFSLGSFGTYKKNANAALIGWRPAEEPYRFEWCLYVNPAPDAGRRFAYAQAGETLTADEAVCVRVDILTDRVTATCASGTHDFADLSLPYAIRRRWRVNVSPWFGGSLPAPQDLSLRSAFVVRD